MYIEMISDPLRIPARLDEMAREFKQEGYQVQRGILGTVILLLDDGKVIFAPGAKGIVQKEVPDN